jgi:porin
MLWRVAGGDDRGLSGFLRVSAGPSDRNPIDLYADGGLTFKGPFSWRADDLMGVAVAYGRISPRLASHDIDVAALTGATTPIRDFELAIELTYQWQLAENWMLQPDLQYIVHPGGNIANPNGPAGSTPIPNTLVFGARSSVKF